MSINTSTIKLDEIKYAYDTHSFITSGETITSKDNDSIKIQDLLEQYEKIFNDDKVEKGKKSGKEYCELILTELKNTIGKTFSVATLEKENDVTTISNMDVTVENILKYTSDFYASAKTINGQTIDSNCLEGYRAYSFYLEKIILLLKKLNDAINQGQAAIKEIRNLSMENVPANQTVEEYVNSKVHELSAELYLADKAIADVIAEFESCLKYNVDTKSWDKSSCQVTDKKFEKPSSLDNLRGITISVSNANNSSDTHEITCFSELNLMDRLRYIRYYYELILKNADSDYQIFPDDSEKGFPCVPDKESNSATRETESMGGFELFYVGYLVDRDGSIDAYSSCLEAKSKAITDNISLQSENIEAYNQYLTFINRGMQLFTSSQSDKPAPIPHAASVALSYLCGGTMRDLIEINGNKYIVIPATNISDNAWSHISTDEKYYEKKDEQKGGLKYNASHVYMLVQADEKGMNAFLGNALESNRRFKSIDIATILANDGNYSASTVDETGTTLVSACGKFQFNTEVYATIGGKIYKYEEKITEILIWDLGQNEDRESATELEKRYLPTQLNAEEILPQSVAAHYYYQCVDAVENNQHVDYIDYGWGERDTAVVGEEANRVINSWSTAFSNKSEYINKAIETINTDITALRTKMDTIDSLCSTLRNRSFETKKTLISNLRS